MMDNDPSWNVTFLLLQPGVLLEGEVENFSVLQLAVIP